MKVIQEKNSNVYDRNSKIPRVDFFVEDFAKAFEQFLRLPDGKKLSNLGLRVSVDHLGYMRDFHRDFYVVKKFLKFMQSASEQEIEDFKQSDNKFYPVKMRRYCEIIYDEFIDYGITLERLNNYEVEKKLYGSPNTSGRALKKYRQQFTKNNQIERGSI